MIDDTGPRITALERRVAEIEARMVAQPIRATNSSGTPSLAEAMDALRKHVRLGESKYKSDSDTIAWGGKLDDMARAVLAAWDRETPYCAKCAKDRDTWKARAEAGDRVLEQVLLWWRAEEELSMSAIVEKIRAHLQKGTP